MTYNKNNKTQQVWKILKELENKYPEWRTRPPEKNLLEKTESFSVAEKVIAGAGQVAFPKDTYTTISLMRDMSIPAPSGLDSSGVLSKMKSYAEKNIFLLGAVTGTATGMLGASLETLLGLALFGGSMLFLSSQINHVAEWRNAETDEELLRLKEKEVEEENIVLKKVSGVARWAHKTWKEKKKQKFLPKNPVDKMDNKMRHSILEDMEHIIQHQPHLAEDFRILVTALQHDAIDRTVGFELRMALIGMTYTSEALHWPEKTWEESLFDLIDAQAQKNTLKEGALDIKDKIKGEDEGEGENQNNLILDLLTTNPESQTSPQLLYSPQKDKPSVRSSVEIVKTNNRTDNANDKSFVKNEEAPEQKLQKVQFQKMQMTLPLPHQEKTS